MVFSLNTSCIIIIIIYFHHAHNGHYMCFLPFESGLKTCIATYNTHYHMIFVIFHLNTCVCVFLIACFDASFSHVHTPCLYIYHIASALCITHDVEHASFILYFIAMRYRTCELNMVWRRFLLNKNVAFHVSHIVFRFICIYKIHPHVHHFMLHLLISDIFACAEMCSTS